MRHLLDRPFWARNTASGIARFSRQSH